MRTLETLFVCTLVGVAIFFAGREYERFGGGKSKTDTIVVRETVRDTVLVPREVLTVRTDTVWLRVAGEIPRRQTAGDTAKVAVEMSIERKIYQTDDYRAVVEGFRPNLVEMDVYRQTQTITNTISLRKKRWGLGVQIGGGVAISKGKIVLVPYIGVGVSYDLITF